MKTNNICEKCKRFADYNEGCVINHETQVPMKFPSKEIVQCPWFNKTDTSQESMLDGDLSVSFLQPATTWNRVLNAARRTIGKSSVNKTPSDSWKAKILLAEHSPIRLLEYDFGWNKIRQWVTTHFVRHHEGVEKFVHSQRADRRELPCDRDHIYQGAKNDMDMSCNAQAMINISRKRLCSCASKETREAWKLVMDELEKVDPMLRKKCVPECVYRGFCPEWMNSCGYYKTDKYKKELAEYRNTKYGDDVKTVYNEKYDVYVTNTGHVYKKKDGELVECDYKVITNERYTNVCIDNPLICVGYLVLISFVDGYLEKKHDPYYFEHIDGNIWNNNIDNLKY